MFAISITRTFGQRSKTQRTGMTRSCADVPEIDLVCKVTHSTRLADHSGPILTKPSRTQCAMHHSSSANSGLLGRGGEGFTCPRAAVLPCHPNVLPALCEQAWEVAFDARLLQQGQRRRLRSSTRRPRNCEA